MGRNFDEIDIIFIFLISLYLVVLFVLLLWVILSKLESMQIKKKGKSRLSSNTKFDKFIGENTSNKEELKVLDKNEKINIKVIIMTNKTK